MIDGAVARKTGTFNDKQNDRRVAVHISADTDIYRSEV